MFNFDWNLISRRISVHPDPGLESAIQQKSFQEFILKLELPNSIRLGEVLKVNVSILNNAESLAESTLRNGSRIEVIMMNYDGEFEFVDLSDTKIPCNILASTDNIRIKSVKANDGIGSSTFFPIRALKTGEIKIKVKATWLTYVNEIKQTLYVEPEGMIVYGNIPILIDLRNKSHESEAFYNKISIHNAISDSIELQASVVGDLLGPALVNVHRLMWAYFF